MLTCRKIRLHALKRVSWVSTLKISDAEFPIMKFRGMYLITAIIQINSVPEWLYRLGSYQQAK